MPIDIWPLLRPFLVMAILLSAMYEPKKGKNEKKRDAVTVPVPDKEEVYDAEYEQL